MTRNRRPKKKQVSPLARGLRFVIVLAAVLAGLTAFVTNLDKLGELWRKYSGQEPIGALEKARNLPTELLNSSSPVYVELVQAANGDSDERVYDLYLENNGATDLLLSEVRYGPGAAYASTIGTGVGSREVLPTASYTILASSRRGTTVLSPPFRLRANGDGALRLTLKSEPGPASSRGMLAFEIYSASGNRVAAVNRMLSD